MKKEYATKEELNKLKVQLKALSTQLKQLGCDHKQVEFLAIWTDGLDGVTMMRSQFYLYFKKCENCGKTLKSYGTDNLSWQRDKTEHMKHSCRENIRDEEKKLKELET